MSDAELWSIQTCVLVRRFLQTGDVLRNGSSVRRSHTLLEESPFGFGEIDRQLHGLARWLQSFVSLHVDDVGDRNNDSQLAELIFDSSDFRNLRFLGVENSKLRSRGAT